MIGFAETGVSKDKWKVLKLERERSEPHWKEWGRKLETGNVAMEAQLRVDAVKFVKTICQQWSIFS